MTTRPPADAGMALEDVDTPALLIELDAFEWNLRRLADVVAATPVTLRPHGKANKCPAIAHKQMALGAVGVCCQKVSEAEAMVMGGVPDVFISNEIVDAKKLRRLASLARQAEISVCVDNVDVVAALDAAARQFGVELRVLVEINVGHNRCGIQPGDAVVPLARAVDKAKGLRFGGIQGYHGTSQHFREFDERRQAIEAAAGMVEETLEALDADGLACETVTGGGTGTYPFEIASGVYTELQPGSYIFMDAEYRLNFAEDGGPFSDFRQSLFVYTTVISHPVAERMITDAGTKALSVDSGMPVLKDPGGVTYAVAGDEHGRLDIGDAGSALKLGDKVQVIPSHCDITVGLHDWFVGVRDGRVESVWPITGRGPGR